MNEKCYAIIIAGGIWSRFWPISMTNHPKQFIDILGTGKMLNEQMIKQYTRDVKEKRRRLRLASIT